MRTSRGEIFTNSALKKCYVNTDDELLEEFEKNSGSSLEIKSLMT